MPHRLSLLCMLLLVSLSASADTTQDRAAELFAKYVALQGAFDPALADLYSDSAVITNKRTYPTGEVRELSMPAGQYKSMIAAAMPLAKARGDKDTFTDIVYVVEGERVRVTAQRHSQLKDYSTPLILLVGAGEDGVWQILEEHTESRP